MTGITKTDNENLIDSITKYHDDLEHLQEEFHKKVIQLELFYANPTLPDAEFVYQYDPQNQKVWIDAVSVINSVLSVIDLILMEKYMSLKKMDFFDMKKPETIVETNVQDSKPSILDKLIGHKSKSKTVSIFEFEKKDIESFKKIKDDWYTHVDYHSRATSSLHDDFGVEMMKIHLIPEKTDFRIRLAKIETVFDHYLQLKLAETSTNAKDILTAVTKMQHQERNDFMANPQQ